MRKHGYSSRKGRHPIYYVWLAARGRCNNPRDPSFKNYGGRGIYMDSRWNDFAVFMSDMLPGWKPGLMIERKDNDGPYSKENCAWATRTEQNNNSRKNKFLTHDGKRQTISQWERELGVPPGRIVQRIIRGWPESLAITAPSGTIRRNLWQP